MQYDVLAGARFQSEICHLEHKVVKIRDKEGRGKVLKILTFHRQNQCLLMRIKLEIQKRKDYLCRRYQKQQLQLNQMLMVMQKVQEKLNNQVKYLKVLTPYIEHDTLALYYNKVNTKRVKALPLQQNTIYLFQQFFQLILRGGGIENFFYTPHNIFIIQPDKSFATEWPKLLINYGSFTGLKLLNRENNIKKEEFLEIYPLLPPQFFELLNQQRTHQIERISKMRALGWLILTFILKKVPDLLYDKKLNVLIQRQQMQQLLLLSNQIFKQTLKLLKSKIDEVGKKTNINLFAFLTKIFLGDYRNITWTDISQMLFGPNSKSKTVRSQGNKIVEHQINQIQQKNENISRSIIKLFWRFEKDKQFYLQRVIEPQSYLYMVLKLNIDFHVAMRRSNIIQLLRGSQFSQITCSVFEKTMKLMIQVKGELQKEENNELKSQFLKMYHQLQNWFIPKSNKELKKYQLIQAESLQFEFANCFNLMGEQLLWGNSMMRAVQDTATGREIVTIHKTYQAIKVVQGSFWFQ